MLIVVHLARRCFLLSDLMSIWMIYMNDTPGMSIVEFCVYIYGMGGDRHGRHVWDWILYMLDGLTLKEGNGINLGSMHGCS